MNGVRVLTAARRHLREFHQSLLFYPVILSVFVLVLFLVTATLDRRIFSGDPDANLGAWEVLFFSGSPSAAQSLLSAIATMWAGITGVAFSVTLVALTLAATKYSAQVVPQFQQDRLNQVVLGAFLGTVVYSLLVLRTVRTGGDEEFTPTIGVNVSLAFAIASLFLLVLFLQNIASYIQPKQFVDGTARRVLQNAPAVAAPLGLDGFVPLGGSARRPRAPRERAGPISPNVVAVRAPQEGYLQAVDWAALHATLDRISRVEDPSGHGWYVELKARIGALVGAGEPLLVIDAPGSIPEEDCEELMRAFLLQGQRTIQGDPEFGIMCLTDIALTAMSGGSTDLGVAMACSRQHFLLARTLVDSPEPVRDFRIEVADRTVMLRRSPTRLFSILLRESRVVHDKAVRQGYWHLIEGEMEGVALLLEAAADRGAYDRFHEALEWGELAFGDVCASIGEPRALERMVARFAQAAEEVRLCGSEALSQEVMGVIERCVARAREGLRERLLEMSRGGVAPSPPPPSDYQ